MNKLARTACLALLSLNAIGAFAQSQGDKIVNQISALKDPRETLSGDPTPEAVQTIADFAKKRDDLIVELFKVAPSDARTAGFMEQRWTQGLLNEQLPVLFAAVRAQKTPDMKLVAKSVTDDIDKVLAGSPPAAIIESGRYVKLGIAAAFDKERDPTPDVNSFIGTYPKSKHIPELLLSIAQAQSSTADEKTAALKRIVKDYPNFEQIAQVRDSLKQNDAMNKPFELKFTDALTGQAFDVASLRGKVVLVDFWATWCGPCVAEMPLVRKAYDTYHSKGLEIVGVSLDEPVEKGGLTKLKEFVKANQIPWRQYYQGNGWESKFSSSWGIESIPTMFAVDKEGKFVGTVDPREGGFEDKIQKLLAAK